MLVLHCLQRALRGLSHSLGQDVLPSIYRNSAIYPQVVPPDSLPRFRESSFGERVLVLAMAMVVVAWIVCHFGAEGREVFRWQPICGNQSVCITG